MPAEADANDNVYHVTVKAEVLDQLTGPRGMPFTGQVKVTVANVNEKPVFPKATDTRKINENLDDPNKEPDGYLLNRGVGTPIGGGPIAPNLDVGRPVVAEDDDNNSSNPRELHHLALALQKKEALHTLETTGTQDPPDTDDRWLDLRADRDGCGSTSK